MLKRRDFLGLQAAAAVAALAPGCARPALAAARALPAAAGDDAQAARDEAYWAEVGRAFSVDRSVVNFNNGGVSPAPIAVQEAQRRWLDHCNSWPSSLALLGELAPDVERVRERLARVFGAEAEELAIVRNASEGLQALQFGFDLQRGDELLTTNQDYPRMRAAFRQRVAREGLALREISLPVPAHAPDEIVRIFEQAIGPRTRLILCCHVINLTGQVLPVKEIVAMARARGIPVIVDGAHALAHLDFRIAELDCDYYATSLHKWLFAPHGTGLLYVRREKIAGLWPLLAADASMAGDIRKFEEIGTHPLAMKLAIMEALDFHEGLGASRKLARLTYLRDRWAVPLRDEPRARLHTSLVPGQAGGIATIGLEGIDTPALQQWLWTEQRILTTPIVHPEFHGLRVSPSVYNSADEVDRFADCLRRALRQGLPAWSPAPEPR